MNTRALVIRGHQGTGKSALGQELNDKYGVFLLSKDIFYLPALEETRDHITASRIAYASIRSVLLANRNVGAIMAIDAPFHENEDVLRLQTDCVANNIVLKSLTLVCSDSALWDKRLYERSLFELPNHMLSSTKQIHELHGTLARSTLPGELIIDTSLAGNDITSVANRTYEYIMC